MSGVTNILRPALGGSKFVTFLLRRVEKCPYCFSKTFHNECRGSKSFHFTREGVKQLSAALREGPKFLSCYFDFDHPPTAEL